MLHKLHDLIFPLTMLDKALCLLAIVVCAFFASVVILMRPTPQRCLPPVASLTATIPPTATAMPVATATTVPNPTVTVAPTATLIRLSSPLPTPDLYVAGASQYGPGVMERVIANRVSGRTAHDLPQYPPAADGWIAVQNCNRIGEMWELRPVGQQEWESFLVVDCSGHVSTTEWLTENNIAVEVDYQTAVRWNAVGERIQVEVREWKRQ